VGEKKNPSSHFPPPPKKKKTAPFSTACYAFPLTAWNFPFQNCSLITPSKRWGTNSAGRWHSYRRNLCYTDFEICLSCQKKFSFISCISFTLWKRDNFKRASLSFGRWEWVSCNHFTTSKKKPSIGKEVTQSLPRKDKPFSYTNNLSVKCALREKSHTVNLALVWRTMAGHSSSKPKSKFQAISGGLTLSWMMKVHYLCL